MHEKRRSRRTASKVPLEIRVIDTHRVVLTAVINRHGALIHSPVPWAIGTLLEIRNQKTGVCAQGRVVWSGGEDVPGSYKLGVEFEAEMSEFWGDDYRE